MRCNLQAAMKRTAIGVEPVSTHRERRRKRPFDLESDSLSKESSRS
jgi:hypothetical protein